MNVDTFFLLEIERLWLIVVYCLTTCIEFHLSPYLTSNAPLVNVANDSKHDIIN